jgi:hypothetical protein
MNYKVIVDTSAVWVGVGVRIDLAILAALIQFCRAGIAAIKMLPEIPVLFDHLNLCDPQVVRAWAIEYVSIIRGRETRHKMPRKFI